MIHKLRQLLSTYENDISHGPGGSHVFSTWLLERILTFVREGQRPSTGRELYEDYCDFSNKKSLVTGADLPDFNQCPPAVQAAWYFVANRAAQRAGFEPMTTPKGPIGDLLRDKYIGQACSHGNDPKLCKEGCNE